MVGTDISIGDTVITDARGIVQIRFLDNTELVVGPRSALVIKDFLLREDKSQGKMVLDALAGTFRFVTGIGPKDQYQINTPTGTLGVRGTAFDFYVEPLLTTVLAYEGEVIMCAEAASCATLKAACEVGQTDQGSSKVLGIGRSAEGIDARYFRRAFRFALSQSGLLPDFRIANARRCSRQQGPFVTSSRIASDGSVPVVEEPPVDPPPAEPAEPSGSCAGNSQPNPGNSQNCTGK